jgi:phosphate acetyltransferase
MALLEKLVPKAKAAYKTIVLPEGMDPRVAQAAAKTLAGKIAKIKVLATADEWKKSCEGVSFPAGGDLEVIDWNTSPLRAEFASKYAAMRAAKGKPIAADEALKLMGDRLYFGNMMVQTGLADGLVAGSIASTGDMLRAAFQVVGTAKGIKLGSSCFIMELKTPAPTGDDVLLFADCAVNPNPTAEQLVDIALATVSTHRALIGGQARVAFLSFSSYGSAKHELVDKVRTAVELTKAKAKELGITDDVAIFDGDMQADAAIVAKVGASKCKGSSVAGKANILIFPDLQAGNICYKLVERLAGAQAVGPFIQGAAKPVNDLSRGCSSDDIAATIVVTCCQAIG